MTAYTVPLVNRLARRIGRPLFRLVFRLLSEVTVSGKENVPKNGAYIVAGNHISLFEPPLIVAFWPIAPEAMGAIEIWERPGQSFVVRAYKAIPVHRGEFDRQLLDTMIAVIQSGRPLYLAPEGERSHQPGMQRGHPGVAYLAYKTGVPVIPVGVMGTSDDFFDQAIRLKRPKLEIRIGKPIALPAVNGKGAVRREALQANADLIMSAIATLLPPEYRGIYPTLREAE